MMSRAVIGLIVVGAIYGAFHLGVSQKASTVPPAQFQAPVQLVSLPSPSPQPVLPLQSQPSYQPPPRTASIPAEPPKATPTTKQKAEAALTAAAIAALIVTASRQAYYSTGKPCACPDDRMRNGRSCGNKSAYSRPGGAQPLCSAQDVTPAMIQAYRSRMAER